MATHSSILAGKITWTEEYSLWGHKELDTTEQLNIRAHREPSIFSGTLGQTVN